MLGRQPVVDGYDDRIGAHRVLARRAVVGVEVAHHEAAAVEIQHHGRGNAPTVTVGMAWRPVNPDVDGTRRTGDGPVLDPQLGMQRAARQVTEPLPGRVDALVSR